MRIKEGSVRPGSTIRFMAGGKEYLVTETGIFTPRFQPVGELCAGDVGYIAASIKTVADTRVGDTITDAANPAAEALPGYKKALPVVFCGIYPADGGDYDALKEALEKLQLNDAALSSGPETSVALGFGFRCGFSGLLHMEIIQQRLERELT
ncbi:MAG: EF-Tu/IF-2/RF-3 family GTPase [Christensenellaceae bacterium]